MKKSFLVSMLAVGMLAGSGAALAAGYGSVKLYEDKSFTGRTFNVGVGKNVSNLKYGTSGFNDKCSSVKFDIPEGWTAILYTDTGYKGREYPMSGNDSASDMGDFEDKCSSIQWVRAE